MDDVRRAAAVATSVFWFVVTAGVGAVLVPGWLTGWQARQPYPYWGFVRVLGIVLIALGLIPPVHVFAQFVRAGGTPMPGAMTTRLVVSGFNRYVRNPIYLGALTIFIGEALLLGQASLLGYAGAAWAGVAAFVHWYEEPALARRFGADYEAYRRAVPAWIPRPQPWSPIDRGGPPGRRGG
jgi:protein-S-isoprenylcysteine O-methyltransferase Ste14